MFLKNRGCLNLPTRYICKFSPIALAATLPVRRTLLLFPPEPFSPDKGFVLVRRHC